MYGTQVEEFRRGQTERVGRGNLERVAMWEEQTEVEPHENLRASQNRSRSGLGFVPKCRRASETSVELRCTGRPSVSSSNGGSASLRHTFANSERQQAAVEQRAFPSPSRTKLESSSRSRRSRDIEQLERSNPLSGRSSRKRNKHRSRSHSVTHIEHRKRRSHMGGSEASLPQRHSDALHAYRRDSLHREVRVEENSENASGGRHKTDAEEETEEVRRRPLHFQEAEVERSERLQAVPQKHSSRRSRSGGVHGSRKRRSLSYSKGRVGHAEEKSSCEDTCFRKLDKDIGKSSVLSRSARNNVGAPSASEQYVRRAGEERKDRHPPSRAAVEGRMRHREGYKRNDAEDRIRLSRMEKEEDTSSSRSNSHAAPRKDKGDFRKDKYRCRTDCGGEGRATRERRDDRVRGGSQRGEAPSPKPMVSSYGDEKKSRQHVGNASIVTARYACKDDKRRGGTVRGRTNQLPSLYHGSAEDVLKQRIRERIREVEQRKGICSVGSGRDVFGSEAKPAVLTAREGNLTTWKHLITSESREAFEADDSRGNWNAVLDRQEKEQLYEDTQRIVEHEDETRFSAFLEMKRREKLQAAAIRKAVHAPENQKIKDNADSQQTEVAPQSLFSSSKRQGECTHLNAIFGRTASDSLKCVKTAEISDASTTLSKAPTPAEVATTTLPGLKGVALLADAVVMQAGNNGAGWKLRRQLQRQQKLCQ